MEESIRNFPKQFLWDLAVQNSNFACPTARRGFHASHFIICGMGGSALAGDLLRITNKELRIMVWRDYGLPPEALAKDWIADALVIASSYSGNTEETISSFKEAIKRKLRVAVITTGGKLLALAKKQRTPYIQIPNTCIQPRMATGYMIKALLKIMRLDELLREASRLPQRLNVNVAQRAGKELAEKLRGKLPIIYASNKNMPVAYTWKIKLNETGKIPAFANRFPELNHNEMTGFDNLRRLNLHTEVQPPKNFSFIFLEDPDEDPRILKRMKVTKRLYEKRKLEVRSLKLEGQNQFHKIFQNLLIADWTAFYLARYYGADPEQVPMVEEFKKLIK